MSDHTLDQWKDVERVSASSAKRVDPYMSVYFAKDVDTARAADAAYIERLCALLSCCREMGATNRVCDRIDAILKERP